jgi:hypothetical protein
MSDREHQAGAWNWLINARTEHWFKDADNKAICGGYMMFGPVPKIDQTLGNRECKSCRKKLDKLKLEPSAK